MNPPLHPHRTGTCTSGQAACARERTLQRSWQACGERQGKWVETITQLDLGRDIPQIISAVWLVQEAGVPARAAEQAEQPAHSRIAAAIPRGKRRLPPGSIAQRRDRRLRYGGPPRALAGLPLHWHGVHQQLLTT